MDFITNLLQNLPAMIVTMFIAFTVHEYAHAYAAYKFGDPTAKNMGRLTLNPIPHIDPIGAIMLIVFGFGWAKPVPVNYNNFRGSKWAAPITSIVGPLSNLVMAFIGVLLSLFLSSFGLGDSLSNFFQTFIWINIILFIFNMLPFPPLDGFHIIRDLSPKKSRMFFYNLEKYGMVVLLVVLITPIGDLFLDPIFSALVPWILQTMFTISRFILGPFL